jgi:hypothetical protein
MSLLLISILPAVKTGLQKYHDPYLSNNSASHMWQLRNLSSRSQYLCYVGITSLIFLSYIPRFQQNSRFKQLNQCCFSKT